MEKQYAVVMGRNYTSRLGMIRAAGMAGCQIAVIKTDKSIKGWRKPNLIDSSSKYTNRYFCVKEPDDEGILNILLNYFQNDYSKTILLPTDDYTAAFIDRNMDVLSSFLFPNIDLQKGNVISYMDKSVQKKIASKAGLRVANGWTAHWEIDRYRIPEGVSFPCFIKPEISFTGNKKALHKCDNKEQLESKLENLNLREHSDVLIEEYIEIEKEYDIPGLSLGNLVIMPGVIEKSLIYRGVTGSGIMYNIDEFGKLYEKLNRFLCDIGFIGLIDIELYKSNGRIFFNELNMRFGASGFGMTGSGLNLPKIFIDYLNNDTFSHEKEHFVDGKSFVSEKVCFEKYMANQSTWQEYKKTIRESDFRFIKNADDPMPGRIFKLYEVSRRLIHMFKS